MFNILFLPSHCCSIVNYGGFETKSRKILLKIAFSGSTSGLGLPLYLNYEYLFTHKVSVCATRIIITQTLEYLHVSWAFPLIEHLNKARCVGPNLSQPGVIKVMAVQKSTVVYIPHYLGLQKYTKKCVHLRQNCQNLPKWAKIGVPLPIC